MIKVMLATRRARYAGAARLEFEALVEEHDEADIIIDASAPLIHSIVAWAETTGSGRHLLFKTENSDTRVRAQPLKARGCASPTSRGRPPSNGSLPVLVYERPPRTPEFHRKSAAEERG